MFHGGNVDPQAHLRSRVAKAFFHAVTKHSDDNDDILPQEDGESKLSVYALFAELFPEHVKDRKISTSSKIGQGLTRLQFNKLGYEIYVKEQSRRVPAPHAKPGNPGYGFRRAKWRNPVDSDDERIMRDTLMSIGVTPARFEQIRTRVEEFRVAWDHERRPSRPAGPGRPALRGKLESSTADPTTSHSDTSESPPPLVPLQAMKSESSNFMDRQPSRLECAQLNVGHNNFLNGQFPPALALSSIASMYSIGQTLRMDKINTGSIGPSSLHPWSGHIPTPNLFPAGCSAQAMQRVLAPPACLLPNAQINSLPSLFSRFPPAASQHSILSSKVAVANGERESPLDLDSCAERSSKRQRGETQSSETSNKASLAHLLACTE